MKILDTKNLPIDHNTIFTQFKNISKAAYMGDIDLYDSLGTDLGFTAIILSDTEIFDEIVEKVDETDFDPEEDSRVVMSFNLGNKFLTLVWESPYDVITSELSEEYDGLFVDEMGESLAHGGFTDNDSLLDDPKNKHFQEALTQVRA